MEENPVIDWKQLYLTLEQQFHELEKRCAELLVENQALREKLNTNSNNSSKPPSQDPNRPKRSSQPSGKKRGGQPGHSGHKRRIYPSEKVNKTVEVRPKTCPTCASWVFDRIPVSVEVRQVVDLPEITPEIIQYKIKQRFFCKI